MFDDTVFELGPTYLPTYTVQLPHQNYQCVCAVSVMPRETLEWRKDSSHDHDSMPPCLPRIPYRLNMVRMFPYAHVV